MLLSVIFFFFRVCGRYYKFILVYFFVWFRCLVGIRISQSYNELIILNDFLRLMLERVLKCLLKDKDFIVDLLLIGVNQFLIRVLERIFVT